MTESLSQCSRKGFLCESIPGSPAILILPGSSSIQRLVLPAASEAIVPETSSAGKHQIRS